MVERNEKWKQAHQYFKLACSDKAPDKGFKTGSQKNEALQSIAYVVLLTFE